MSSMSGRWPRSRSETTLQDQLAISASTFYGSAAAVQMETAKRVEISAQISHSAGYRLSVGGFLQVPVTKALPALSSTPARVQGLRNPGSARESFLSIGRVIRVSAHRW